MKIELLPALILSLLIEGVKADEICKLEVKVSKGQPKEFKCNIHGIFYPIECKLPEFSDDLKNGVIVNGDSIDFKEGFVMDRVFQIPAHSTYTVMEKTANAKVNTVTGTKNVLAIWVKATNAKPTLPIEGQTNSLADDVFGIYGDPYNPRSQYKACSNNKLDMAPANLVTSTGVEITNGVYALEVGSPIMSIGKGFETIVQEAATKVLGDLPSQFDHVMFCMPKGVKEGGVQSFAYAYLNSYLSVYGDKECHYETGAIHEFGHNFGLDHSNEGPETKPNSEYEDYSGQVRNPSPILQAE